MPLLATALTVLLFAAPASAQTLAQNPPATTQTPAQTTPATNPTQANAQQARDLLTKCIQALGGQRYLNFVGYEQRGRGFGFEHNESQGVGLKYHRIVQFPDKERYEMFSHNDWVQIFTGGKGYEVTFRGAREIDAPELADHNRRAHYALDSLLRIWLADPATALFYDGTTMLDTHQVHKVTLVNAQNESASIFLDINSLLPVGKSYTWRDPQTRDSLEESETFDEYRPEDGIQSAHKITRTRSGEMQSQRFITEMHYNPPLPASLFAPPPLGYNTRKK